MDITSATPTQLPGVNLNPESLFVGQIKIATTGVAVPLPNQRLTNGVVIKAKSTNVGSGFVGGAGVTTADDGTGAGYRLMPGEAWSIAVQVASSLWINGTAGDVYYFTGN